MIYADDTPPLGIVDDLSVSARGPNSDLNKIAMWADKLSVTMNPVKSRNVVFSLKGNKLVDPTLILDVSNAYMSSKMPSLILTWV